jgi:hypothetical protein
MSRHLLEEPTFIAKTIDQIAMQAAIEAAEDAPVAVRDFLAQLRLLYGLPFDYIVPRPEMLPPESIRFFYIDRNWTDRLVDGALSVGKVNTRDYMHHHFAMARLRTVLDGEESVLRRRHRQTNGIPTEHVFRKDGVPLSGMLMRSRIVSGWVGMEVRAYNKLQTAPLPLLRMDRLSPGVLLCLFEGIPELVEMEEPREGIMFGVEQEQKDRSLYLFPRHIQQHDSPDQIEEPFEARVGREIQTHQRIAVPLRDNGRNVINVESLAQEIAEYHNEADINAIQLATQMLQYPHLQKFGDQSAKASAAIWELATMGTSIEQGG